MLSENFNLTFSYLPALAKWIIDDHLDEFSRLMLEFSKKEQVPLLKYFSDFTDEQLIELGKLSGKELLQSLADNNAFEYIRISVQEWETNRINNFERDAIVAEDIGLISFVRRCVFRVLVEKYSSNISVFKEIMEEVDRFTAANDIAAFNAYINIREQQVNEMNRRLQEQQAELLEAQQLSQIGSFYWDMEGRGHSAYTPMVMKIFELEKTGSLESFYQDVHPEDREKLRLAIEKAIQHDGVYECEYRYNRNNKKKRIWSRGVVQYKNGRPVALKGTVMDVTATSELVDKLKENEEYLAQLITNAPDAIIVIDQNSIIQLWNPKTEEIFGWKPEEVIGRHLTDTIIPPRYRAAHNAGMRRFLDTGKKVVINQTTELVGINKNNEELFISLTVSQTFQQGSMIFIAFLRDITKEKQTQIELKNKSILLEKRNIQLEHSNRELESFNYAASHDLQEPLRKIRLFTNRINEENPALDSRMKDHLQKISSSAIRMQQLIDDLLRFSQSTAGKAEEEIVSLTDLMNEAKTELSHEIEVSGARITYEKLPVVKVIRFQFLQLFLNFLSNAIKYQPMGNNPQVWINAEMVNGSEIINATGNLSGRYLKLSFNDNGIGFDPKFSDRVFDLFVRLHGREEYSGTGIGLAICKKIVQNHEGFLKAESEGKGGSSFHVYIPERRVVEESDDV